MPFFDTGATRLHYLFEQSAGRPVLVLSHSLGTDVSLWDPQAPRFREYFSLLRVDTRGHGNSSVPLQSFDLADLGRDMLHLLDHLALRYVSFCGLSMGGLIGQWLGVNANDRLDRLVLANTAARIGTAETWNARIHLVRAEGMQLIASTALERWFTREFRQTCPDVVEDAKNRLLRTDATGYAHCCAAIRDADLRGEIDSIRAPVLVVSGREDPVTTPSDAAFLTEHIASATSLSLPAAHLSNVEAAEDFTSGVLDFLLAHTGGQTSWMNSNATKRV